jgi:hypothetical protein
VLGDIFWCLEGFARKKGGKVSEKEKEKKDSENN